jgi:hypothetical protein
MQRQGTIQAALQVMMQVGLAMALLLGSASHVLAQDTGAQAPQTAGDPNASAVDDVLDEMRGDTTMAGSATSEDPAQLVATDAPEFAPDSTTSGPQVDENGERGVPIVGDHLLFLPAIKTNGTAGTRMASESPAAAATYAAGGQRLLGDFNGDGFDDLAIGAPYEDVVTDGSDNLDAGAVTVIYGSAAGLTAAGSQVWTQGTAGVGDVVEPGDTFGYALAVGDFNADGSDDLAIGVRSESFGSLAAAGAVQVIYGSAAGLTAAGSEIWTQDSAGMLEVAETGDYFGAVLATGDFDGDGCDDLAIGVPNEDIAGVVDAGIVQIMYGSHTGLAAAGNQVWHQSVAGIPELVEKADQFGSALAAGDFDADGRDDLAVGVPFEDINDIVDAGVVHVVRGSAEGLTAGGSTLFSAATTGTGAPTAGDRYGWALAAGDFDGSGFQDLAIGVPYRDVGPAVNAGMANLIFGAAATGLDAASGRLLAQGSAGLVDTAEAGDTFGYTLAAGQFDGIGPTDLAIGVPNEDVEAEGAVVSNAGAVQIAYGPLGDLGSELWTQDSAGVLDAAEAGDLFGLTLVTGDFDGNGRDDLVAGVPFEDLGGTDDMGAVNVLYGPLGGQQQFWSQDSAGILGVGEADDWFGLVSR